MFQIVVITVNVDHAVAFTHIALGAENVDKPPAEIANHLRAIFKHRILHRLQMIAVIGNAVLIINRVDAFSYYASKTLDSDAIGTDTPVNYYLHEGDKPNPYLEATEWGWQIDPLGFRAIITRYYNDQSL